MTSHQVRFSIIIPTRGRVEQLQDCLDALCALDYPTNLFEVIVVDDGGELSEDELRQRFQGRLALRCTRQEPRGPAEARNVGARLADFETLAFTDDDCRPAPDWLNVLAAQFGKKPNGAVAGRVTNAIADSRYSEASTALVDFVVDHDNADMSDARFATSNNLAVGVEPFIRLGGFDPRFTRAGGEDRDFCDRWRELGYRIRWVPEAIVSHHRTLGLQSFLRQQFGYGRGAYRFRRGRANRRQSRLVLERPSFYFRLVRWPRRSRGGWGLTILMGVAQVAVAVGFLAEAVERPGFKGDSGSSPQ